MATAQLEQITNLQGSLKSPVRIALIGCGAISRQFHLPVLAGHEGIELAVLVDRDRERAAELAKGYGVKTVLTDAGELDAERIDAAIVATPPFHHAACSIELMRRGIHVLVEKPMATRFEDAEEMVRTAEEQGVVLHVGVFRRLYPSLRLLRGLLDSEYLGRPRSFSLRSGGGLRMGGGDVGESPQGYGRRRRIDGYGTASSRSVAGGLRWSRRSAQIPGRCPGRLRSQLRGLAPARPPGRADRRRVGSEPDEVAPQHT